MSPGSGGCPPVRGVEIKRALLLPAPVRSVRYVVAIGAAFCLILLNALYGHHLYGSPYQQSLDKYSVYVHLQPGWRSAPANILYDVTVSWGGDSLPEDAAYNANRVTVQNGREAVLLYHGFSDCRYSWSPPLYRYGIDALRSYALHMQGRQLNVDPYAPLLADVPNAAYSDAEQSDAVRGGYVQFIPVCSSAEPSAFHYSVSVDDPGIAFDVHFVPSERELEAYLAGSFDGYESPGCWALNRQSYAGHCNGVGPDSGLLVVLPDSLQKSLTEVQVFVRETGPEA